MKPVVLTIAGSDPSGGAGIQADLRVFTTLGIAGLSAVSALTVQNSQGVFAVQLTDPDFLFDQIKFLLEDTVVGAVKIGMLGSHAQVRAIASALQLAMPTPIVLDPVLTSTDGFPLLDHLGRQELLQSLLPLCTVITPNIPELALLTGMPVDTELQRLAAARFLIARGAGGVLIKGGHLLYSATDTLVLPEAVRVFSKERIDTPHTHGTGCHLAAALAAHLAKGCTLEAASETAIGQLRIALWRPVVLGAGRGYPDFTAVSDFARDTFDARTHAERISILNSGLYVLTDSTLRPDRGTQEIVEAALRGGAATLQLREKSLPLPEWVRLATQMREITQRAGALFIVNDRVDIAMASDADGVHLGPDDMRPADARRLLGSHKLIGVSVSTLAEAEEAAPWASYLGIGAIFGSSTKKDAGEAIGLERISELRNAFPQHPLIAIGGIHAGNIAQVARAGAATAAVISAVVGAPDMEEATRELSARFGFRR